MSTPGRFPVLLLLATLGSEMYLGDLDIGPFSARVYLYLLLLTWMAMRLILRGEPLQLPFRPFVLLAVYGVFISWAMLAALVQGASVAALSLLKDHAIAVLTFLLILFIVRRREDVRLFLSGLTLLVAVSGVIAILQYTSSSFAWALWFRIRPHMVPVPEMPGFVETPTGPLQVLFPGLFGATFTFGYYIAAFAPNALASFLTRKRMRTFFLFLIYVAAILLVQQRSALLASVLTLTTLVLVHGARRRRMILAVLVLAMVGGGVVWLVGSLRAADVENPNPLGRYTRFKDAARSEIVTLAVRYIAARPLVGGAIEYVDFVQRNAPPHQAGDRVIAPHNLFLNAAVFYGVPGLLFMLLFLLVLAMIARELWLNARRRNDLLVVAILLGLAGYLINAQFHNASFVSGDALPWWLIACALIADRVPATAPAPAPARRAAPVPVLREFGTAHRHA